MLASKSSAGLSISFSAFSKFHSTPFSAAISFKRCNFISVLPVLVDNFSMIYDNKLAHCNKFNLKISTKKVKAE